LAEPVMTQRWPCHLVNSRAMVGIKVLFRQPRRQVHVFHRTARGSLQIWISATHSSLRAPIAIAAALMHVVCLHVTQSDVTFSPRWKL